MAKSNLRTGFVEASKVPDPIACPLCKGGSISVVGYLQRNYTKDFLNGKLVVHQRAATFSEEVSSIYCQDCERTFEVHKSNVIALLNEFFKMRQDLAQAQGKTIGQQPDRVQ